MDDQFASIEYVLIAPDILVPLTWPIQGIEGFVLRVLRRIIRTSQQENPIIKLNDIPVRLVRNHSNGFPFVCELVPTEQVTGGDIYEIIPPEDENNNVIEVVSGSDPEHLQERTFWARIREPICILRAQLLKLMIRHPNVSGNVERRIFGYGRPALPVSNYVWYVNDKTIFLQVVSAGAKNHVF